MSRPVVRNLADLANLGPKSRAMLAEAGITSIDQLRQLGAVAAYARVRGRCDQASLNLLWAFEGALTGLPWQVVAREHRTSLLLALEQLKDHVNYMDKRAAAVGVADPTCNGDV